jgi:hypothetical protein
MAAAASGLACGADAFHDVVGGAVAGAVVRAVVDGPVVAGPVIDGAAAGAP